MQAETAHIDVQDYREPIISCEQCGTCSSACPLTGEDGFNIRRIERAVQLGLGEEIAATRLPWICTTCGRCEAACPNGYEIMTTTRALRALTPPEVRPDGAPCMKACPAGVDAPRYVRLIAEGRPADAYAVIRERVPFPGILGRVCARPCETQCRRAEVNQAISICALKRYAADKTSDEAKSAAAGAVKDDTGRKVAVVGSGPAGLTAAYYLRKQGHAVTVFEAREKAGGMMRYGIPAYRLPEEVLDEEIGHVLGLGVELQTGAELGTDFTVDDLEEQGFDAVFLAVGAQDSRKVKLEGTEHEDVLWGVEFLSRARYEDVELKDRVVVIGGGNVAVDVALTALRSGAEAVTIVSLEDRDEMPAFSWEIEEALEEGVEILPTWGPSKIIHKDGKVAGVELVHCTSVFDDSGAFCPMFGEDKTHVDADQVILAIGQQTDLGFLDPDGPIELVGGLIEVDLETQETGADGIWAGGDAAAKGPGTPGTIIEAIASGRRAAAAIDKALGGDGVIEETLWEGDGLPEYTGERENGFADLERVPVPTLSPDERSGDFAEVAECYTDDQASAEAGRCLCCDLEIELVQAGDGWNGEGRNGDGSESV